MVRVYLNDDYREVIAGGPIRKVRCDMSQESTRYYVNVTEKEAYILAKMDMTIGPVIGSDESPEQEAEAPERDLGIPEVETPEVETPEQDVEFPSSGMGIVEIPEQEIELPSPRKVDEEDDEPEEEHIPEADHVSVLTKLTTSARKALSNSEYHTVGLVAISSVDDLVKVKGVGKKTAIDAIMAANAHIG